MKYDGKWFGDHLESFGSAAFKKEVASTFDGDPNKDKKIAELFALFHPPSHEPVPAVPEIPKS